MTRVLMIGVAALLLAGAPAVAQPALDRAGANWIALQNGSKRLADLSGEEIAEVNALDRQLARRKPVTSRDCERGASAARSELDRAVLSLKCPPVPD